MTRKHWIDNLRWVTVLLVLLYHVVYFYNNKGIFGGIGGFGDGPQYQDVIQYILYPWFMPLLFLLAGVCARYSLERNSAGAWFKSRTRKLLVPATIGLLVFHWMTGYFNTHLTGVDVLAAVPQPVKYFLWVFSGVGPLWFIQDLWLFSLLLLLVRKIDAADRLYRAKLGAVWIFLLGIIFWLAHQALVFNLRPESLDGLWNLYQPVFYFILFLMGYYIFSREEVQEILGKFWILLMTLAVVSGVAFVVTTFGANYTLPQYMAGPLYNLYGWLMCLALMGWFKARFDRTGTFATYMTRSSFGLYVVHYLVVAGLGSILYRCTTLPPWADYAILTVAVFGLLPLLYEILHRIPFIRWCLFGIKKNRSME